MPAHPPWDVVWLSDVPWASLWQRPQQLATRFPDNARILFVEPWTLGCRAAPRPVAVAERIARVSLPYLPLHARSLRLRRVAFRLGSSDAAVSVLGSVQRAWARTLEGWFRPGARRLALVESFASFPTLEAWRPDRVVYDLIDAPLAFAPVPRPIASFLDVLLRRADRVITTSAALEAFARNAGAERPARIGNGVAPTLFSDAHGPPISLPGNPEAPVVGYVGSIHGWFDVPLVVALARALPDVRVVLVGPGHPATEHRIVDQALGLTNLHRVGVRPYSEIPLILRAFRVGLIPFRRTPLTEAVEPVKLYEYAAAGVPCVTTRFSDELERFAEVARIADTREGFVEEVRGLLATPPERATLRSFAARHDWRDIATRFVAVCLEDAA